MATPQTTGTATPMELDPEQAAQSLKVSLADLSAKATAFYAHKNYDEAAEVYAQAAEMQAEMNGEMSPDNAEILFLYGRALFKVGQSKSDVLGGKAPDAKKPKSAKPAKKTKPTNGATEQKNGNGQSAAATVEAKVEEVVAEVEEAAAEADEAIKEVDDAMKEVDKAVGEVAKAVEVTVTKDEVLAEKKPLFHFEGDENFEDSDEEEGAEEGDEEEEEDDDLAVAFEILDLARVLFEKKLELLSEPESDKGKEVSEGDSPAIKHIKERLGDTHDLLAEISLENERYVQDIA
jgi:HAT1-interacting factor 1